MDILSGFCRFSARTVNPPQQPVIFLTTPKTLPRLLRRRNHGSFIVEILTRLYLPIIWFMILNLLMMLYTSNRFCYFVSFYLNVIFYHKNSLRITPFGNFCGMHLRWGFVHEMAIRSNFKWCGLNSLYQYHLPLEILILSFTSGGWETIQNVCWINSPSL